MVKPKSDTENTIQQEGPKEVEEKTEHDSDSEEEDDKPEYNYCFFHVTFFLVISFVHLILLTARLAFTCAWCSLIGLLLENQVAKRVFEHFLFLTVFRIEVDQGVAAVWVKMASSWVTIGIYVWSLIAPIVCKNRQF